MIYNLIITVVTEAARCFQGVGWTSSEVDWAYIGQSHGNPTQGWQNHVGKPWAYTKSHRLS